MPQDYFKAYLEGKYPRALRADEDGWDWTVTPAEDDREAEAEEASRIVLHEGHGEIEVEIEHEAIRYDGPRIMPKDVQDVGHPIRCENLQIPGPSNPMGAAHVWLRDYPTIDEIKRLGIPATTT
jgi:hypothetical protein